MRKLLFRVSHILARFGFWLPAIVVLLRCGSLDAMDQTAKLRLQYCFLMMRRSRRARGLYAQLLRRELDRSAETNFTLAAAAHHFERHNLAALIDRRTARQTHPLVQLAVARAMAEFDEAIVSGEIYGLIAMMVDRLTLRPGEDVIMVTASQRYLEMFSLWLEQTRKHVSGRILGIAMDQAALTAMNEALDRCVVDISRFCVFDEGSNLQDRPRLVLWVLRVLLLREIVRRGHRLLSIDLDAVAIADLAPMLNNLPEADIVVQKDYSIPMDVARRLGFVLCCGFMVFSPTAATISFMDRYARRTMHELDDQLAVNHMIEEAGVKDMTKTPESMSFHADGVRWVCPDKSLVSRDVTYGSIVRHFQQQGQTIDQLRAQLGLLPVRFTEEGCSSTSALKTRSLRSLKAGAPGDGV